MSKKEKYFEKNSNLAFNLTIKLLGDYAEKCQVDSDKNMMDPILGTYNLVNQFKVGFIYKSKIYNYNLKAVIK